MAYATHIHGIRDFISVVLVALGNYQVSDDGWMSLFLTSRGLRTLRIPDCPKLTNSSLRVMANLKGLMHLDISYSTKFVYSLSLVSDSVICRVAPCDSVCLLSTRVGDSGIQYLTKGLASTKLTELNLSHCSNINDSSVMKITQRCMRTMKRSNAVHRVAWSCI